MKFVLDDRIHEYTVEGDTIIPEDQVLIELEDDLTINTSWHERGYSICPLFTKEEFEYFHHSIIELLLNRMVKNGISMPDTFELVDYHKLVRDDSNLHLDVIKDCIELGPEYFPFPFQKIENRISELLGIQVESIKPMNGERVFHFRIIRPNQPDFNPLHKDAWLDELKDAITIYIPIVGSNENSSLLIADGTHLMPESSFVRTRSGAMMNNIKFNVPGLVESKVPLNLVRPNPQQNEVLVFSPYLIHGGAINSNPDKTRVSLEMRFWRKKQ